MAIQAGKPGPLYLALAAVVGVLVLLSLALALVPGLSPAALDARLDVVISTAASIVAAAVAALAWGRFREQAQVAALYQASAFLLLGVINAVMLTVELTDTDASLGMDPTSPGQLPLYLTLGIRFVAAGLLVIGALAATRRWSADRQPARAVVVAPTLILLVVGFVAYVLQDRLPPLIDAATAGRIVSNPTAALGPTIPMTLLQGLIGALFLWAAYLYLRLYERDRHVRDAYLAVGLVVAAFSQVHYAVHPGGYAGLVTSGDVLRLGFYGILLVGIDAERRHDLRLMRRANDDLRLLHETELARTALEERARLAREVHDGLAQDLWYAKLKQGRLARLTKAGSEARQLVEEVATAVDSALTEARQAVLALRSQQIGEDPFREVLARYVDDFADRFGIRTELAADAELPTLDPRAQAELLRIVQEAMNNSRRHADATLIRVRLGLEEEPPRLRIEITDNGRGFDPNREPSAGYGLVSMRERAALIGGSLSVSSAEQDGTSVRIELPIGTDA